MGRCTPYQKALRNGWQLPDSYAGYAFLSYECQPLATRHVSSAEVLRFRDQAWQTYFTNPAYLNLVQERFGAAQRANVEDMARVPMKRCVGLQQPVWPHRGTQRWPGCSGLPMRCFSAFGSATGTPSSGSHTV